MLKIRITLKYWTGGICAALPPMILVVTSMKTKATALTDPTLKRIDRNL